MTKVDDVKKSVPFMRLENPVKLPLLGCNNLFANSYGEEGEQSVGITIVWQILQLIMFYT